MVLEESGHSPISELRQMRLRWLGHVARIPSPRMPSPRMPSQLMFGRTDGAKRAWYGLEKRWIDVAQVDSVSNEYLVRCVKHRDQGDKGGRAWCCSPTPSCAAVTAFIGLAEAVMERSLSDDARQMYKLKQAAVEFYHAHGVPQNLEEALNSLFHQQPEDIYGQLVCFMFTDAVRDMSFGFSNVNHFSVLCKPAVVKRIEAWQALDNVGCPTIAVQLICTTRNMEQRVCSLVMASEGEPPDTMALGLKDQEYSKKKESSQLAVQWINHSLSGLLTGQQPYNQSELDCLLREFLKEKLSEVHQQQEQEEVIRTEFSEPVVQPPAVTVNSDKKPIKGKKSAALEKPLFHKEMRAPLLPGSVAIGATSMAIAKAAARLKSCPLYKHIASLSHTEVQQTLKIPVTMVTVLCCGKASPGKLNLLKEVMVLPRPGLTASQGLKIISEIQHQIMKHAEVVPKTGTVHVVGAVGAPLIGCDKLERPLEIVEEVARSLGLTAGVDFHLALNCAAHEVMDYEKSRYEVASGSFKATTDMVELYAQLLDQHPAVVALIDPLCPEDHEQWRRLSSAVGGKCFIFNENSCRLAELDNLEHITGTLKATGVIIKHTNQVTVSDLLQASRYLQGKGLCVAFGACSGDTPDGSLVDMALGMGASFLILGGVLRGERVARYNHLVKIEWELLKGDMLEMSQPYTFPVIADERNPDA